nr:purine permease 3-like [Ipomoea batatas]
MMCIGGNGGGPLLLRLYFIRGGDRICTTTTKTASFFTITQNIIFAAAALGVLFGRINYVYTYGVAKLPVSTSSLIVASQLAFTADAAFVLVKQRFTVNAVVLLTIGAEVLVVGSSGDRPAGESKKAYVAEFLMALWPASNDLTH